MELKLNIYTDEFCYEVEKTVTANAFKLSLGICEDVLNIVNIDMFEGGLDALSDESKTELAVGIVRDGFPFFKKLVKGIFRITDDEIRRTDITDIAVVVIGIVTYSFTQLASSLGGKKAKN